MAAVIEKIAVFLEKAIDGDEIKRLTDHLSIENFRKNKTIFQSELIDVGYMKADEQSFVRSGQSTVDGWPNEYTPEVKLRFNAWMERHLRETTLVFPK